MKAMMLLAVLVSVTAGEMMKADMRDMTMVDVALAGPRTNPDSTLTFMPEYSRLLDTKELVKLIESPSLGTVYYYKEDTDPWTRDFLNSYDKSAGFLNAYGLILGLVDCSGTIPEELEEECDSKSEKYVYTFREGSLILELDVKDMFNVDSIMANILILVMMDNVFILRTEDARRQMEQDNAGKKNVVMAYISHVGTYESRVFFEIAYAYQDKYTFAITSEITATNDLQDIDILSDGSNNPGCLIWMLYCSERYDSDIGCRSVNYRGTVNLLGLATFFKRLDWPRVVDRKEGGSEQHPCEAGREVACVTIAYTPAGQDRASTLIESLQFDLHGMVGLIAEQRVSPSDKGDPAVIIQKLEGKNVTVDGNLELTDLEFLIAKNLFPHIVDEELNKDEYEDDTETGSEIDDMVVTVYKELPSVSNVPHVPALTDETFPAVTKNSKLTVVLFYIPFDPQGMVFLQPFQEAGLRLVGMQGQDPSGHPLARVNCFDWTDVCEKENITSYPVVHIYRQGRDRQQYPHALDTDVLVRSVMLLQADQPLVLRKEEEVATFLEGRRPSPAYRAVHNLVLLKLSASRKEMEAYTAVVKALETEMLFAVVEPNVKTTLVPDGGVVHKRTKDAYQPVDSLTQPLETASIIAFLRKGQFPVFPELTFLNFPALYARKQPLAILFYKPSVPGTGDLQQTIVDHIMGSQAHHLTFCKMTVGDSNPEAMPLLMNYTQTAHLPAFTIVNHQMGRVYVLQDPQMTGSALLTWIQEVQKGAVAPTKILDQGEWKPAGKHYDFLAKLDEEAKEQKKKKQTAEEPVTLEEMKEDNNHEEEVETRASLQELHKSRLYHTRDRRMNSGAAKDAMTATVDSMDMAKTLHPKHTEL